MFIHVKSLSASDSQFKNSNISKIHEKIIIQTYHNKDFKCIYIESIYSAENNIKYKIEYTIASGKIGTLYGI